MKKFIVKVLKFISTLIVLAIVFFVLINLLLPLKYDRVDGCDGEKTFVVEDDGRYIYTLCMNNVKVRNWTTEIPFEEYITKNKNWYKKLKPILSFPSAEDEYAFNLESINYRLLECNTKKNKNIYIMPLYTTSMSIDCTKEEVPSTVDTNDNNIINNNEGE